MMINVLKTTLFPVFYRQKTVWYLIHLLGLNGKFHAFHEKRTKLFSDNAPRNFITINKA